ncbi:hypothetical protein DPM33_20555 [Mesorhizobium hawassense]|uniref:HTH araC/xylS-type domain-containing protein n=2 Tax=Mesorhizobium hawassense TaxID=1209954 RepID=A0A330HKS5_9HYPH|nr:hypothetical protein DPM33_20555 [Mesorhizobium hawassense]
MDWLWHLAVPRQYENDMHRLLEQFVQRGDQLAPQCRHYRRISPGRWWRADVGGVAETRSARIAQALPGLDECVGGAVFDLERSADRTGFRRDGLAPVRASHRPESVARRRPQPLGFHGAVFRRLRRIPMSLLRRVRMRHAADLLAANALSIDQVAFSAGYQSRSSFSRTFRRYYGCDLSEYRARAQRTASSSAAPAEGAIEQSAAA